MRKIGIIVVLLSIVTFFLWPQIKMNAKIKKHFSEVKYENGEIIFQTSNSRQCEAVKMATHSDVSHCGILFQEEDKWFVLEAVEPVQIISLAEFIKRGTGQHYTIKRLKQPAQLSSDEIANMLTQGRKWVGKHYDIYFNWSGAELYCSELVWKLYHDQAKIDLCKLRPLRDYDLKNNLVGVMMKERYGDKVPYDELMVAPSDIFASEMLQVVETK
jgi:hypothetical protein